MGAELRDIAARGVGWVRSNRRASVLLAATGLLALLYLAFFVDWFRTEEIVILHRIQAVIRDDGSSQLRAVFDLDEPRELRRVSVYELDESGDRVREVWRLVRDSGGDDPERVEAFVYGRGIRGMKEDPAVDRAALIVGGRYELIVIGRGARGQTSFIVEARSRIRRGRRG